jgi:hypothetical protein
VISGEQVGELIAAPGSTLVENSRAPHPLDEAVSGD